MSSICRTRPPRARSGSWRSRAVPGGGRFGGEDTRLRTGFADQAALALDRTRLTDEAARTAALEQSDELKSALLAAVSHDPRTPLAAIKASATSLLDQSVAWDGSARSEFLEALDEETDRLTLVVGNLLDLSRIEGGAWRPDLEWYDVAELVHEIGEVLSTSERVLVLVGDSQSAGTVLRNAWRYASALRAELVAVTVRQPDMGESVTPERRSGLERNVLLAEDLGAEVGSVKSRSVADGLADVAKRENASIVVIGDARHGRWSQVFGRSLVDKLLHRMENVDVYVAEGTKSVN